MKSPDMETPQYRRLEDRVPAPKTTIAAETSFRGEIEGTEGVRIAGRLEGDIKSSGLVWIEPGAAVQGDITCPYAVIEGELNGGIHAAYHVEIRSTARMTGNIEAGILAIADGGRFEGSIQMPGEHIEPIRFQEKRRTGDPT